LIAPHLIIAFSAIRSKRLPSLLEVGARLVEAVGGAAALLTGWATGIKSAGPFPLRYRVRCADGARNDADVNVAVMDQPAIFAVRIWAAGEVGIGTFKPSGSGRGNAYRYRI
jgi:hypothetical protein